MSSRDRLQDSSYQRWAQSFRSRESLSAAGKEGYSVTTSRYGKEYLHDRMADKRREPKLPRSVSERQLMSMLEELVRHAGTTLTHKILLERVWGPECVGDSHYLKVFIGRLRHKLGDDTGQPRYIHTVWGTGYRFDPPAGQ